MEHSKKLGLSLSLAIAIHNIPEGIAIAVPIYYSTGKRQKAFYCTLISGLSEFLGAIIAHLFFPILKNQTIFSLILGITAGMMLKISITDLLKEAISYHQYKISLFAFLLGILIILMIL